MLELGEDSRGFVAALAHHVERSYSLAVQPHILGIRLAHNRVLHTGTLERANSKRVDVRIATSVALVRGIKDGEEASINADLRELLPLRWRGVDPCRVVCARVEEHRTAARNLNENTIILN